MLPKNVIDTVKTPCYIIDVPKLTENLKVLKKVSDESGAKILLAQKAFSCYHLYPLSAE
jgi:carboxynorspermidine decarboxylase